MPNPSYTFVVPVHDEESCIAELGRRLKEAMELLEGPSELILVNDGSRERILELRQADPRFKVVVLSRNFGHR